MALRVHPITSELTVVSLLNLFLPTIQFWHSIPCRPPVEIHCGDQDMIYTINCRLHGNGSRMDWLLLMNNLASWRVPMITGLNYTLLLAVPLRTSVRSLKLSILYFHTLTILITGGSYKSSYRVEISFRSRSSCWTCEWCYQTRKWDHFEPFLGPFGT
jgi:hypothetical protein